MLAAGLGREDCKQARPVYHLAISAADTDRRLTDAEWADVVGEYVHRIGLAPRGAAIATALSRLAEAAPATGSDEHPATQPLRAAGRARPRSGAR